MKKKQKGNFQETVVGEAGIALIYSLAAGVIASILIAVIFFAARNVYLQATALDKLGQSKDVEELSLQVVADKLAEEVEKKLSARLVANTPLSLSEIDSGMNQLELEFKDGITETDFGKNQEFSYHVSIKKKQVEEIPIYSKEPTEVEGGWQEGGEEGIFGEEAHNVRITFELTTVTEQQESNSQSRTSQGSSEFVYEVQWENFTGDTQGKELELWRNIQYQSSLAGEISNGISADSWMRKFKQLYDFQSNYPSLIQKLPFDEIQSEASIPQEIGLVGHKLVDYEDGRSLDFWQEKRIKSTLTTRGSLLFKNGVQMKGMLPSSELVVNSILGLSNQAAKGQQTNAIKNLNLTVGTGILSTVGGRLENQQMIIDNGNQYKINTPKLLINQSHSEINSLNDKTGFHLGQGFIQVGGNDYKNSVNLNEYDSSARNTAVKAGLRGFVEQDGFIIANSHVYLAPVTAKGGGVEVSTDLKDERKLEVSNGLFMLTSAQIMTEQSETDINYTTENGEPNQPSTLTLEGENTTFIVNGSSFIDAPKWKRRPSVRENNYEEQFKNGYIRGKKNLNTISLKKQSFMDLGTVGIEPFNLEMEKETQLNLTLLNNLENFDDYFLIEGFNNQSILGKLVLKPQTEADLTELITRFSELKIPYSVVETEKEAKNGEVTILATTAEISKDKKQLITRKFHYTNQVRH